MARLAAIDSALKEEQARGLQDTGFYKSLLADRVNLQMQMQDEQGKLASAAGKEAAENSFRMGELQIAAEREAGQTRLAQVLMSGNDRLALERQLAEKEFSLQQDEFAKERAALNSADADFGLKQQQLDDKEEQAERQHQNRMQQIRDQAASQEYSRLSQDQQRLASVYTQGFSKVIMGKESFGKMMQQVDSQIASSMMEHAMMSIIAMDMTKEREAASAARKAFNSGMSLGPPQNFFIAPAWAAAAFASVMAFESGGIVPGVGRGDIVPAMLEPGEGVLSNKQMDTLREAANGDAPTGGQQVHIHHHATYTVQSLDSDGVRDVLNKHGEQFAEHAANHLRKMNK
jgi:hypothetical protein